MPRDRITRKEPPMPDFVDPWHTSQEASQLRNRDRQEADRLKKEADRQRRLEIAARTKTVRGPHISLPPREDVEGTHYFTPPGNKER